MDRELPRPTHETSVQPNGRTGEPGHPLIRCAGKKMTRFKELQRIENAIKNRDVRELEWAVKYCEMRIPSATMKQNVKHWTNLLKKVQVILDELNEIQA